MILILNSESETSCDIVTDWLHFYSENFFRLDEKDLTFNKNKINIFSDNNFVTNSISEIKFELIKTIWFRKFGFFGENEIDKLTNQSINADVINHLKSEYNGYLTIFLKTLNSNENIKWLANPLTMKFNKIDQLIEAKKIGFAVPNTIVTSSKQELVKFYNENKKEIISKCITDISHLKSLDDSYYLLMYTNEINDENIKILPNTFFPTLFQNKIIKEIEIRSFFLDGKFYSMAIFSQEDDTTNVDFRRYNKNKQNRMVPFKLPIIIENKLKKLFINLKIDTGSADIIKATNGEYVFLEINPSGQYGFVSFCCNYQLDKKVAEYLIKLNNGN